MGSKIVLYKGKRGAGKTLTMIKDGYKYYKSGWKVLRNLKACFGEFIDEESILSLDKTSNIRDCVILMDELQIFFDSRRSMKKENMKFSNFIQQVRKRNIIILGTTQYSNTIDLRLRQHIDILAYPKFIKKFEVCEVTYLDMTSVEDDLFSTFSEPVTVTIVYDAKPLYNMFVTEEMK
ncbi:MAG: zonular occludens toxin domain-containing protein [Promethearchaeota archaeon]